MAGVVGLLRGQRLCRLPRHRIQRDPGAGRADRRQPALQVRGARSRRPAARRPGDHPGRDEAQGRRGLLHPVVRRGRQGRRRRHDPPAGRGPLPLDGRRPAVPLADDERERARRRDRRRQRDARRGRPPGSVEPGGPRGRRWRAVRRPALLPASPGHGRRDRDRRQPDGLHGRSRLRAVDPGRPGGRRLGCRWSRRASRTASARPG